MRRFAGSFVRRKHNENLLPIAAGGGVLVGPGSVTCSTR